MLPPQPRALPWLPPGSSGVQVAFLQMHGWWRLSFPIAGDVVQWCFLSGLASLGLVPWVARVTGCLPVGLRSMLGWCHFSVTWDDCHLHPANCRQLGLVR